MESRKSKTIPVIIDTDVGKDDIGAILYLLKHPNISIKAISVSCGLTYVEVGAKNLLKLLDHLGRRDIPVVVGREKPLACDHSFPPEWRETSKFFFGLRLPKTDLNPAESGILSTIIKEQTEKITILAIGTLTDIAELLQSEPSVKEKTDRIFIMGGAVNVSGNVGIEYPKIPNYKAEWNIYVDPHAADIVFRSKVPITLVPLDATNYVPIKKEFIEKLAKTSVTREAEIACQFMTPGLYFWDQLTAVVVTNPSIVSLKNYHIEVIVEEGNSSGETRSVSGEINAQVAVKANAQAFENQFVKIINQR
jgi:pyrimidine-specific ribonucleoside hydrolase